MVGEGEVPCLEEGSRGERGGEGAQVAGEHQKLLMEGEGVELWWGLRVLLGRAQVSYEDLKKGK